MEELPMVTFLKRPTVRNAKQFVLDEPWPEGIEEGPTGDIHNDRPFYTFKAHKHTPKQIIYPTDWILFLLDATTIIITDEEFQHQYELIKEE
jgi:hypothetical protein